MRITKIFAQGWWPIKGAILALRRLKGLSVALCNASITLLAVERELAKAQPMLVRAAVFDLLRTGGLAAPSLHTQKLSLHTLLEPIQ